MPEHGVEHRAAVHDRAVGDQRVERLPRPPRRIRHDLRRAVGPADRAHRPARIVEVELRPGRAEVHLRVVVRLQGRRLVPEAVDVRRRDRELARERVERHGRVPADRERRQHRTRAGGDDDVTRPERGEAGRSEDRAADPTAATVPAHSCPGMIG